MSLPNFSIRQKLILINKKEGEKMKIFQCSGILLLTIVVLTLTSPGYKMGK